MQAVELWQLKGSRLIIAGSVLLLSIGILYQKSLSASDEGKAKITGVQLNALRKKAQDILNVQKEILTKLNELMEELKVAKIRATIR